MKREQPKRIKTKNAGDIVADVINVILMALLALICLYPFYYVLINTFSDNDAVLRHQVWFWPQGFNINNYVSVFRLPGIGRAALMSVARTVVGTCATVFSCAFLGYAMTRQEYWHRKFWYRFLVITMYFNAGLIPTYMNIKELGLMNNFLVYILPSMASAYNMVLVKTYIESIPQSLEEAAIIDGAGYADRFFRVILPLSKPILATIAIFAAVGQWNSYMDTRLYVVGSELQTLQSLLQSYISQAKSLQDLLQTTGNAAFAQAAASLNVQAIQHTITAIVLIPVLCIYPFFQRYFTKGIMIGAVKG